MENLFYLKELSKHEEPCAKCGTDDENYVRCQWCGTVSPQAASEAVVRLNDLLRAKEALEQENAALIKLLTELGNEYMEVDENGCFINSRLAPQLNSRIGL